MYRATTLAILALLAATSNAQALSNVPDLSTATLTTASSTTSATSTSASASSTSSSTTTAAAVITLAPTTAVITSDGKTITTTNNFPTIAGAGIPTQIVPYTAGAPFMQKSDLPEGTVFIAVGAVLAFLGACVLLWRGLVAWSINRSVKRAALASVRSGTEKTTSKNWGGSVGKGGKGGMYQDIGNSVSMEALTPTGKPLKNHFRDHDSGRSTPPPPSNLFFSPTAQARNITPQADRSSSYLPAGYYAQPSSQVAGGARNTTLGAGNFAPYARNSAYEPSPPGSPALRPSGRSSTPQGDHLRAPISREEMRNTIYSQSNSSLVANNGRPSSSGLGGARAPSAYLDEMFENHTAMASRDHL